MANVGASRQQEVAMSAYAARHIRFDTSVKNWQQMLRGAVLSYVRGYRNYGGKDGVGKRKHAVTLANIQKWFRHTDPLLVRIAVMQVEDAGLIVRDGNGYRVAAPYSISLFYPNGDLLDRTHYPSEDDARQEMASSFKLMEAGEVLVLCHRGEELDRIAA
jgi:hypothetical protein